MENTDMDGPLLKNQADDELIIEEDKDFDNGKAA